MLEKVGLYNDLSPELRKSLDDQILSFGKTVRFKFDISNKNPDPEKKGETIWPFLWTLDPITFTITDKNESRKDKQKVKRIGIVESIKENGEPERFKRVRVHQSDKGIRTFNLDDPDDVEEVACLLLHPKLNGGEFADKNKRQIITRIDETALATQQRKERTQRKVAMDLAEQMSDAEVVEFADGMAADPTWDSTQDIGILRNKVEELAENSPEMFNDLVKDKKVKYQAAIKRAIDKRIWAYDPANGKLTWVSTGQTITVMQSSEGIPFVQMAEWFLTNGKNADNAYSKLVALEKEPTLK